MFIPNGVLDIIMNKFKPWRSLKLRLFILIFIVGTIPSLIVYQSILSGYEKRAVAVRTSDVQTQLTILANHLLTYNYLSDPSSDVVNAELKLLSNLYSGRVMVINSNLKIVKDTYGISEGKTMVAEEVLSALNGISSNNYDKVNGYIEITVPIVETLSAASADEEHPEGSEIIRGVLLTSTSTDVIAATIYTLRYQARIIEIIFLILIILAAALLSRLIVKPFDNISKQINNIKEGMNYEGISVSDYDETEHIVSAFNSVLSRMEKLDESRQEFVSNVSHELKTPITSVKVLADSLNANPDTPIEMYREFMQDITAEIEREDKIINDLLYLVKLDKDATSLNITTVDINSLTEIILKRMRPIARKQDVELTLVSLREVMAEVDEVKISLAITNLVENAIKYNVPQGKVTVTIDADHKDFTIEVKDSGSGIPEEDINDIFERFYRVDKSHSREIGGTGLGLSITKSAIARHNGVIEVESVLGEGSTFIVRVPLKAYTPSKE